MRSRETEVEVFGGEVESLTTAVIEGIGVRVVADHRQGYAWAGSLEPTVVDETLRDARDNATFGEPDEWYALAGPADVNGVHARRRSTSGATSSPRCRPTRRCASRSSSTRRRRRPTRGSATSSRRATATRSPRPRSPTRSASRPTQRRTTCSASSVGDRRRRHRPADRLRVRRRPHARRSRSRLGAARRGDPRVPPARRAADPRPAHPGDPRSARDPFGARCAVERVQRRVGAEGAFAVRRPRGRADRRGRA